MATTAKIDAKQILKSGIVLWGAAATLFFYSPPLLAAGTNREEVTKTASAVNEFGFDLYKNLRQAEGNHFFSPYSITACLAMTSAGARGNTKTQMEHVLHAEPGAGSIHRGMVGLACALKEARDKKRVALHLANALWMERKYSFRRDFLDLAQRHYDAALERTDFRHAARKAVKAINSWAEKKTEGRIKDLIDPRFIDASTRLVLTNAVSFQGAWENIFNPADTRDLPFHLLNGQSVPVPMMSQKAKFSFIEEQDYLALEMPYAGNDFSMLVLLPRTATGLEGLEARLDTAFLRYCDRRLRIKEVHVFLPKFSFSIPFILTPALKEMGMKDAFTNRADFSGIDGTRSLLIENVFHSAFVEVNEQGTEASAATAVVMKLKGIPDKPPPVFRADHPFVFFIRHKASGAILFMGRLAQP